MKSSDPGTEVMVGLVGLIMVAFVAGVVLIGASANSTRQVSIITGSVERHE